MSRDVTPKSTAYTLRRKEEENVYYQKHFGGMIGAPLVQGPTGLGRPLDLFYEGLLSHQV